MTPATVGTATIGRVEELARIERCLGDVGSGRGGAVLLSGEPGIGKTRLALEAATAARARGYAVAWGRCLEAGAAPVFWPWLQVVRACVRREGAPAVRERLGAAVADVLSPAETGDLLTSPPAPAGELVASRRFRLLDGVVELLGSGPGPLVVLIEDLHRADELSITMARRMAAEAGQLPVLMVATFRSTEVESGGTLGRALAEIGTLPWCEEVALGALPPAAAAELVTAVPGCTLDPAAVADVVARAGGNPLFLQHLARAAQTSTGGMPTSLREVLRDRIAGLPTGARELLEAMAVAGREVDVGLAAATLGLSLSRARPLLERAVRLGLVTVGPDDRIASFTHALIQEALYKDLDPERRAELHEAFFRLLQGTPGRDPGVGPALADHALRAARGGRDVDCLPPLRAAARAAARRLAFGEASRLLTEALAQCAHRPGEQAAVLLELGRAEAHAGRVGEARPHLERAADLAAADGDARLLAAAALGIGSCVVSVGQVDWALVARLRQALEALEPADAALEVRLRARLAIELYWQGGGAEARQESAAALDSAERLADDPGTLAEAVWGRLFTLRGPGRLEERLALGRRLVELGLRAQDLDAEFRARVWWLPELLRAAEIPAFRANVERLGLLARRSGQPLHRWYAEVFAAERALLAGDPEDAESRSAEAAGVAARLGIEAGEIYRLGQLVPLRRDVGGLAELVGPLQVAADRYPALVTMQLLLLVVRAELGEHEESGAALTRLAADGFAPVPPDSLWTASLCYAVDAAQLLGDAETARAAVRLLEPYRGTCAAHGVPAAWGAVDRAVGLGRLVCGDTSGAIADLEAALALHLRWGFAPQVIRTRLDLAIARGMSSREARQDVEAAAATARGLGLARLARRAEELLDHARPPRVSGPGGILSAREEEVLELLASGVSNAGIAARLVLSINTVERHVHNVYAKLGVTNRVDAATMLVRQRGLRDPRSRGGASVRRLVR